MKPLILSALALFLAFTAAGQVRYDVTHVDDLINTTGSESGGTIIDDSVLLYSTMETDEVSHLYLFDFTPTVTQINQAFIAPDGTLGSGQLNNWGFNIGAMNCGNAAYDAKNDIVYFTRSDFKEESHSHIFYSRRQHGRWSKAIELGGDVNGKDFSSTHPAIGYQPDGKPILYFSSDRPGGLGGMDIWYAVIIKEGMPGNSTNLGAPVNSADDEITPFYSNEEGTLYFSSSRDGGLGGFDIYSSLGNRNTWQQPQHLDEPINSKHNDLFFNLQPCSCRCIEQRSDSSEQVLACGFLTSNRPGSLFTSDSNCCNDLFRWRRLARPDDYVPPQPVAEPKQLTIHDLLPLKLYFHNDEPDMHTLDTLTRLDYSATWSRYRHMRDEYKGAQPSPVDKRKWDSIQAAVDYFFDNEIDKGHADMQQFLQLLYQDLKAGHVVRLTVNGFASPLFEDLYNVNLSKRRISSFRNQLNNWNDGALRPYLYDESLLLESVAIGVADSDTLSPKDPLRDPRNTRSVYSLEAAHARRIEIINYTIVK